MESEGGLHYSLWSLQRGAPRMVGELGHSLKLDNKGGG